MPLSVNRTYLAALALVTAVACGGGGDSTGPMPTPGTAPITMKVDGVSWAANATTPAIVHAGPGLYSMVGVSGTGTAPSTFTMALYNIRGPGTYPVGVTAQVPGASATYSAGTGAGFDTPLSGAAGTVVITELTDARMSGTYSMTMNQQGGTATRSFTDGTFSLPITRTGTIAALPDRAGSKVSATVGGVAFNAASASSIYSGNNLTITGSNNTRTISLTLAGITAPGTYQLSNGTPARSIGVTVISPTTQSWNSGVAGSSGTVVISSITDSRIVGTFTATLGAAIGATGTLTIANGTFDVGRLQ